MPPPLRVQTVQPRRSKRRSSPPPPSPTRLKKPRRPPTPPRAPSTSASSAAPAAATTAKIAALRPVLDAFLSKIPHAPAPPSLLLAIADVVTLLPVPHLLATLPNLPRALLVAARLGILPDPSRAGILALARTLAVFARGAAAPVPDSVPDRPTTRSAFLPADNHHFSRVELEALRRAGRWALALLTTCVRGEPEAGEAAGASVAHSDTTHVFVAPRDALDPVMAAYYRRSIEDCVGVIASDEGMTRAEKAAVLRGVGRKAAAVKGEVGVGVVEALLRAVATVGFCLRREEGGGAGETLDEGFVDFIMADWPDGPFRHLSSTALRRLLSLNGKAWLTHKNDVVSAFRAESGMAFGEQRGVVALLADVAAEHVQHHWELMDHVRVCVGSDDEPFAIRHWKDRECYRAVLAEVVDRLCFATVPSCGDCRPKVAVTPLFRRFPQRYQWMIRGVVTAVTASLEQSGEDSSGILPSSMAMNIIFDTMGLETVRSLPPNAHAVLLCVESLLEMLCWDIGYRSHESQKGARETLKGFDIKRTIKAVSAVIVIVEEIRLPGGSGAEGEGVLARRAMAVEDILRRIRNEHCLPSIRTNDWSFSGLLAVFISGALCSRKLRGLKAFHSMLDPVEKMELRRAAELSLHMSQARNLAGGMNVSSKMLEQIMARTG